MASKKPVANAKPRRHEQGAAAFEHRQVVDSPAKQLMIEELHSEDWIVAVPFSLTVEQEKNGSFVVSDEVFLVYGHGRSVEDAVRDYSLSLTELYEILERQANHDPKADRSLQRIQQHVRRRSK